MRTKENYYNVKQVSQLLGISEKTVFNWCKRGTLSAVKLGGKTSMRWFLKNEIDELCKETK